MKNNALLVIGVASTLIIALTVTLLLSHKLTDVNAQVSCCDPPTYATVGTENYNPDTPKFAPFSGVEVIIQNTFTETERQAIEAAFGAWEAENANNCSYVTFHGFQFGGFPETATVSNPKYWVEFSNTFAGPIGATSFNATFGDIRRVSTTLYANIRVGTPEFLPQYVRRIMKHEIGHTFFLDNKNNCPSPPERVQ